MINKHTLLIASVLTGGIGVAFAQTITTYDPSQLPTTQGKVAEYSLTPRGDIDGVILEDGTQVHLPPHLGNQLTQVAKPGDDVTVRGLRARAIPVIQAVSIRSDHSGQTVADVGGPPVAPPQPINTPYQWLNVEGRVREPLYGPRGDMNGALLEDGTQVHVPPDQATKLDQDLRAGQTLVAQGYGVSGPYGKSLDARRVGTSTDQLVQVGPPGLPPGPPAPLSGPDASNRPGSPGTITASPPPPPPGGAPTALPDRADTPLPHA